MRAGRGLGVVLHRERPAIEEFDAFHGAVVGAGVADHRGAEVGIEALPRLPLEGEAVVLRGDRDPSGGMVDHRHVDPAVAEHHLVGGSSQCPAQDLVAEADAEQRYPRAENLPGHRHHTVGGGRVAGTVGQEHPVRLEFGDRLESGGRRQHMGPDTALREVARRVGLDPQIQRGDGEPLRALRFHDVSLRGADLAAQVCTEHRGLAADPAQQIGIVGQRGTGEHPGRHGAPGAQMADDGAGIHTGDTDDALTNQFILEGPGGPPVRRARGRIAHDIAGHPDPVVAALAVLLVPAGIADLRRGGDDDLAVIAGIGERLLVARHPGGEHRLAEGLADRTECRPGMDTPVLEDENGLLLGHA